MHKLGRLLRSLRRQLCEATEPATSLLTQLQQAIQKGVESEDLKYNRDYEIDLSGNPNKAPNADGKLTSTTDLVGVNDHVSDVIYDLKQANSRADVDRMVGEIKPEMLKYEGWLSAGTWGHEDNPGYVSALVRLPVVSLGYSSYDDENDEDGWGYDVNVVFGKNMVILDTDSQEPSQRRWLRR